MNTDCIICQYRRDRYGKLRSLLHQLATFSGPAFYCCTVALILLAIAYQVWGAFQ